MSTLGDRLASPFDLSYVKRAFNTDDCIGAIMHPEYDNPVHVFYQRNPNRQLGHSEFFGLVIVRNSGFIINLIGEELEDYQWHVAVECDYCGEVIASLGVHDYQTCKCEKAMVDGGSQYIRCSQEAKFLKFNTLTMEVQDHG